jgi:4-hydroxybenzoate polyprenyltransferase
MKLFYNLFLFIIPFINGLVSNHNNNLILRNNFSLKSKQDNNIPKLNNINKETPYCISKIKSASKLIRSVNILPTLFLSFSGGFIANPSIYNLLNSNEFISSTFITLLIVSLSMIFNDLYDIELDKINNPSRPLINGEISKSEAYFISFLFLLLIYFNERNLSNNLQELTNIILFGISIYTPIIKKVTFIKNIFCAAIVSLTIIYSALSVNSDIYYWILNNSIENTNYQILLTTMRYIFLGSLSNELLLDMCDMEGDKLNNIKTVPVLFGKNLTFVFIMFILFCNILNILFINNDFAKLSLILYLPVIIDMYKIKKSNYEKIVIDKSLQNLTIPMFLMLLYMGYLAYI